MLCCIKHMEEDRPLLVNTTHYGMLECNMCMCVYVVGRCYCCCCCCCYFFFNILPFESCTKLLLAKRESFLLTKLKVINMCSIKIKLSKISIIFIESLWSAWEDYWDWPKVTHWPMEHFVVFTDKHAAGSILFARWTTCWVCLILFVCLYLWKVSVFLATETER